MPIADVLVNKIMADPRFSQNPTMQNAFNMYRNGNISGVEQLTKTVCQTQGKNIDELINQAKGMMRR